MNANTKVQPYIFVAVCVAKELSDLFWEITKKSFSRSHTIIPKVQGYSKSSVYRPHWHKVCLLKGNNKQPFSKHTIPPILILKEASCDYHRISEVYEQ